MVLTRRAYLTDIPELLRLCDQASAAGVCPGVPVDHETLVGFFSKLMVEQNSVLMVVEKDGRLAAACGALMAPYHFNQNVQFVYGAFLWSDPAHPGHGARAVAAVENWGRTLGAHKILLTINDTLSGGKRGADFLSHRGYEPEETNYVRTL